MKKLLNVVFLSAILVTSSHSKYAEDCRAELQKPGYYSRGWSGISYLDMEKAQKNIQGLYEAKLNLLLAAKPGVATEVEIKHEFCHAEIQELEKIYGQTTKAKEYLTTSTSGECLKILKDFCSALLRGGEDKWVILDEDGAIVPDAVAPAAPHVAPGAAAAHAVPHVVPHAIPPVVHAGHAVPKLPEFMDGLLEKLVSEGTYKVEVMDPSNGTRWWLTPSALDIEFPESGWKMHVGLAAIDPVKVVDQALRLLREHGVFHKVIGSEEAIHKISSNPTQSGKMIAIYPKDEHQMIEIAKMLDGSLVDFGEKYTVAPFEAKVGRSGALTVRYGILRYGEVGEGQKMVVVDRQGTPVLKVGHDGKSRQQTIPDSRDGSGWEKIYAPDFVNWNPFTEAGMAFEGPPPHGWPIDVKANVAR